VTADLAVADVLRGARPPGIYPAPADLDLTGVLAAGWRVAVLDGRAITEAAELLGACAAAWQFPPWYGHNFDALADCLVDLSWLPAPGYLLHWRHAELLAAAAPVDYATACQVFRTAAARRAAGQLPPLYVLLAGTDPE
jgi:RNAse (barnase) inhibitor barstar